MLYPLVSVRPSAPFLIDNLSIYSCNFQILYTHCYLGCVVWVICVVSQRKGKKEMRDNSVEQRRKGENEWK